MYSGLFNQIPCDGCADCSGWFIPADSWDGEVPIPSTQPNGAHIGKPSPHLPPSSWRPGNIMEEEGVPRSPGGQQRDQCWCPERWIDNIHQVSNPESPSMPYLVCLQSPGAEAAGKPQESPKLWLIQWVQCPAASCHSPPPRTALQTSVVPFYRKGTWGSESQGW
jgi:hypothetical protein